MRYCSRKRMPAALALRVKWEEYIMLSGIAGDESVQKGACRAGWSTMRIQGRTRALTSSSCAILNKIQTPRDRGSFT